MTDPRVEAAVESIRAFPFWNFGMDDVNPSDEYAEWVPALATRMVAALAAADAVAPTVDRDTLVDLIAGAVQRAITDDADSIQYVADALLAAGVGGGDVQHEWAASDVTSVELEQWPDHSIIRATREAAENEFVYDGDDVLLWRTAPGPWLPVEDAPSAG